MYRASRRFILAGLLLVVTPALLIYRSCHPADERAAAEMETTRPGAQAPP
jgi:hypothetical protein